jgi:hypothetical protein
MGSFGTGIDIMFAVDPKSDFFERQLIELIDLVV